MVYLYLALSGILDGGVIFGAKVLSNLGASLFELMIYPNLLSVCLLLILPAVICISFGAYL